MTPRIQAIVMCAIAALALVNCSNRKPAVRASSTRPVDMRQLRVEAPLPGIRPQPSDIPKMRGWWYVQHPNDLAAGLTSCDRGHEKLALKGSIGKQRYDCDEIIRVQEYIFQQNPKALEIARVKCAAHRYKRAFFSECRAARLAEERNKQR